MEKNERLAWRTKPRTYCRCFSSCPKRHCKRKTFQLQIKKTTFRAPKSCFSFPFQTLLGPGTELFRCFFQLPKAPLQRENLPIANYKNNFSGSEKLFFIFPSRHSWDQALSFSGAFSSCPKRHCKGRTFQMQIKKANFRLQKVVFLFSLPDTLGTRHWAFQVLFPAAQSAIAKGDPSNCKLKKQLFGLRKVVFLFSIPDTLGTRHWAFQVLFPAAQSAIAKGDPSNCK